MSIIESSLTSDAGADKRVNVATLAYGDFANFPINRVNPNSLLCLLVKINTPVIQKKNACA
jgi:hypothetical protein